MRIKKIGQWIQYTGGMGKTFYFNEKTFEFQWEKPENMGFDDGGGEKKKKNKNKKDKNKGANDDTKKNTAAATSAAADISKNSSGKKNDNSKKQIANLLSQKEQILQEWKTYRDPETNMTFFYNESTQESLWEPPPGLTQLEQKLQSLMEQHEADDEDGDAAVVDGLDDLGI